MVTGANSGIGYVTALELARRGATVDMVCRNAERGDSARRKIVEETGNERVELRICDMSSMENICGLAAEFEGEAVSLHGLINNAGCMVNSFTKTKEGIEVNFATNSLGVYHLTKLMIPSLRRGASGGGDEYSRVVFVSSGGMLTEPLVVADVEGVNEKPFDGARQYSRNKRQQVVMAMRFADMYRDDGVHFYSMHPGWCDTDSLKEAMPGFYEKFKDSFRTVAQGADSVVWLAISKEVDSIQSGEFVFDRHAVPKHLPLLAGTQSSPSEIESLFAKYEDYLSRVS
uniref:Dehydrogenase/reductase SDR family member 12 n=2 Tax=Compsopogon caeruleus TaxID=31354 RepID=A0A7S1TCZ4_9RHOD|mmetsp:Transcript_17067/g.35528  ORF Transcript_17067/g.35528 Transcript_17067/m.35528 type:complete len:286 (+) Transcript_17067:475-1332(+)